MQRLTDDPRISAIIARLPVLSQASSIHPLEGGLTNTNYRVNGPAGPCVMRISDPSTALLGINRDYEKVNTERAHEAGVGPAVIGYLQQEAVLVISWIEARTLHADDFHQHPELIQRVAQALQKLHSGPAFQGVFHFPEIRKKYLKTVLDHGYFMPEGYIELENLVSQLEAALALNPEPLVPCNNDLLPENFMDDGKKIWIIDYEYSGQNEASFEIGNLASEASFNEKELSLLCETYWQHHLPAKIYRAMAWSMIARFGWVLWASIQEAVSAIDFDFRSWGLRKWNSVLPELRGPQCLNTIQHLKKFHS